MQPTRRTHRPGVIGATMAEQPVLSVVGLSRTFGAGSVAVRAVDLVDLVVEPGTLVALRGRSGSGKTTLLNLIAGLDRPDVGQVHVAGTSLDPLDDRGLAALRRDHIGFIFQAFGLLPVLTAAENVEVPLRLRNTPVEERRERVAVLLDTVGLAQRATHLPHELSGGEQQRVAVARALATEPALLLADEPTAQLDTPNGREVMVLLRQLVDAGTAALVATHDPVVVDYADRVVEMMDGRIAAVGNRLPGSG